MMHLVKSIQPLFTLFGIDNGQQTAVVITQPCHIDAQPAQPAQLIELPPIMDARPAPLTHLAALLLRGRQFHPLCRNAFVERVQLGYYAYERRYEWRTCALAAAYAGAFGASSIERPDFSYSMAVWRVSQRIGIDIGKTLVTGPTGRENNIADEMIKLTDDNLWDTDGLVEWLGHPETQKQIEASA